MSNFFANMYNVGHHAGSAPRRNAMEQFQIKGAQNALAMQQEEQAALKAGRPHLAAMAQGDRSAASRAIQAGVPIDLIAKVQSIPDSAFKEKQFNWGQEVDRLGLLHQAALGIESLPPDQRQAAYMHHKARLEGMGISGMPDAYDPSIVGAYAAQGPQAIAALQNRITQGQWVGDGAPPTQGRGTADWAVPEGRVTSQYGMRAHPKKKDAKGNPLWLMHNGIDVAGSVGAPVPAAQEGTVVAIDSSAEGGTRVVLEHPGGYLTEYLHLSSDVSGLKRGQFVRAGQPVGTVGPVGPTSTGPHWEFRVRRDGKYIDPLGGGQAVGTLTSGRPGQPVIANPDGTVSTERSITVTDPRLNGGRPTNIPSLWDGVQLGEQEAVTRALQSGQTYQSFNSIDEAVQAAKARSNEMGVHAARALASQQQAGASRGPTYGGASGTVLMQGGKPIKFGDGVLVQQADGSMGIGHLPGQEPTPTRDTSWQTVDGKRVLVDDQTGEILKTAGRAELKERKTSWLEVDGQRVLVDDETGKVINQVGGKKLDTSWQAVNGQKVLVDNQTGQTLSTVGTQNQITRDTSWQTVNGQRVLVDDQTGQVISTAGSAQPPMSVSVTTKGETEAEKAIGKGVGEAVNKIRSRSQKASRDLQELFILDTMADRFLQEGGDMGFGAETKIEMSKILSSVGVDPGMFGLPEEVGIGEAITSLSNQRVLGNIGTSDGEGGMPANNFSNTDLQFVVATVPTLSNTPVGFKIKVEMAQRIAERNLEGRQVWQKHRQRALSGQISNEEALFLYEQEMQKKELFTKQEKALLQAAKTGNTKILDGIAYVQMGNTWHRLPF